MTLTNEDEARKIAEIQARQDATYWRQVIRFSVGVVGAFAFYAITVFPFVLWSGVDVDANEDLWGGVFMMYGILVGVVGVGIASFWASCVSE